MSMVCIVHAKSLLPAGDKQTILSAAAKKQQEGYTNEEYQ
jgi:hypothetical protein